MRTEPSVEIAELRPGDAAGAAAAQRLLNQGLGDGMYGVEGLLADAAEPTAGVWLARAGEPVGAAVARLLVPDDVDYYRRFGPAATGLFDGTVGSFEGLAVDPRHRRRGIGARLTLATLDWMRAQGCDVAVALAWLSGRPDSSPPLFRHLGFREGLTIERFYAEESVANDWSCPVCGQPCTCAATFFALPLR
jgi:GNAT superfamily N-acetyltransferase